MMNVKPRLLQTILATLSLTIVPVAHAVVIDFDEFAFNAPPDIQNIGSSLSADGFDFNAEFALVVPAPADFRVASRTSAWQADPGFATILMTDYPVRVSMTRAGGPFDFASIDLADSANVGVDRHVSFTFNYAAGGSDTEVVVLDMLPGLQTFVFDRSNLESVQMRGVESFVGEFPWYQFDNINVTAVPEPASYLVALMGLAAVAWAGRRSKTGRVPANSLSNVV